MAIVRESPRFFNSTSTGVIVAATCGFKFSFGFNASYVKIENYGTTDIWAKFNTTCAASTDDIRIRTCEPARVLELTFLAGRGPAMVSLAGSDTGAASGASVFAWGE